jgi:hypothetical protein
LLNCAGKGLLLYAFITRSLLFPKSAFSIKIKDKELLLYSFGLEPCDEMKELNKKRRAKVKSGAFTKNMVLLLVFFIITLAV